MALERLSLSVEMEGHRPCAKKQQNLVPGEGGGPNVCRFGLSGWLLRDDAGIWALPSVQIVELSSYEIDVSGVLSP